MNTMKKRLFTFNKHKSERQKLSSSVHNQLDSRRHKTEADFHNLSTTFDEYVSSSKLFEKEVENEFSRLEEQLIVVKASLTNSEGKVTEQQSEIIVLEEIGTKDREEIRTTREKLSISEEKVRATERMWEEACEQNATMLSEIKHLQKEQIDYDAAKREQVMNLEKELARLERENKSISAAREASEEAAENRRKLGGKKQKANMLQWLNISCVSE
jgi:chromosome segregation ATPase